MRGDTSGSIIHPYFIHGAHAAGMHFCAGVGDSPAMIRLHARHAQRALEQILEVNKSDDMELQAQVSLYSTSACLSQRWFQIARSFLTRGCSAVNTAIMRFIPASGRPPELTEEVQERLAILSQLVYLENYLFLAIDQITPNMTARIEKEFRHELQVKVSHRVYICLSLITACPTENLPTLVRDLPIDHADTGNPAGQGRRVFRHPLFD